MTITLPRQYLSYSAINFWNKDKEAFRDRYYRGIKPPDTSYTLFGREVHEQIETDEKFSDIRLPVQEQKIITKINNIPILGYIDTVMPVTGYFGEYKTGIRKPDGSPRWTQSDVQKHMQIPFYSLLIEKKFGIKARHAFLVWLETEWEEKSRKIGSTKIVDGRQLKLTGEYKVFTHYITEEDRKRVRKWIKKSAQEISEDYIKWMKS